MKEHSPESKPWVAIHEKYGDIEGHILGNSEGLKQLKVLIDESLETGVGPSRDLDCDFNSVKVLNEDPRKNPERALTYLQKAFAVIGLVIVGIVLICTVIGALSLWEFISR